MNQLDIKFLQKSKLGLVLSVYARLLMLQVVTGGASVQGYARQNCGRIM